MSAFNIGSVIEPLEWDFTGRKTDGTTYPGWPKSLKNAKGTIPEPTDAMIGQFLEDIKKSFTDIASSIGGMGEVDENDPESMLAALNNLSGDSFVKAMALMAGSFGKLCSNEPSAEQILELPMRARSFFYSWVMGEVVRPEAVMPAGNVPAGQAAPVPPGSSAT